MKNVYRSKLMFLLFFVVLGRMSAAQTADLILTNGKIFTSSTTQPYVQALAVKGNKILAVGTNAAISKLGTPKTRKIDLQGKTVVPGFNDAHDHLGWLAPIGQTYTYTAHEVPGPGKAAVLDSIARLVKKAKPGQWIKGPIGLAVFLDPSIRRKTLDSLAPNNPVLLSNWWGHGTLVNSLAMKAAGIADTAPDPMAGWYERAPGTNTITGALYEYAQWPAWEVWASSETAPVIGTMKEYAQQELAFGITTVQNMTSAFQGTKATRFFQEANLPLRVRLIPMPGTTPQGRNLAPWKNALKNPAALTYVSGIKYVIDGTPLEQTALNTKPYPNRPDYYGRLNFPQDSIKQILKEALTTDTQLMIHMVGDSTTSVVLSLMKQMASPAVWKTKRVRIEHATGLPKPALWKDVKDMGIVIVHTPQHGIYNALKSLLDMGIHVALGPDGLTNPFVNIVMVTTQQNDPEENITREQAVRAYTSGGAYAERTEKEKGELSAGKLADFAVLSQDIFTIPPQQLPATRSLLTVINGKMVYGNL